MEAADPPAVAPVPLAEASRRWLLFVARRALRHAMAQRDPAALDLPIGSAERPDDPRLDAPARVYVSWYDGAQSGPIGSLGSLEPWLSLEQAVARYAVPAAAGPRLPAARASRWHRLVGEISILGAAQELAVHGLDAIAATLVPNRDGVILGRGLAQAVEVPRQQAVALPSAWRHSPRPRDLLVALMRTAGLAPEHDGPRLRVRTFLAESFAAPVAAPVAAGPSPDEQVEADSSGLLASLA
jgi:AMMECR1 domain-containing protein